MGWYLDKDGKRHPRYWYAADFDSRVELRRRRKAMGLTQVALAKKANVPMCAIAALEIIRSDGQRGTAHDMANKVYAVVGMPLLSLDSDDPRLTPLNNSASRIMW